jgi:hypothetical protein
MNSNCFDMVAKKNFVLVRKDLPSRVHNFFLSRHGVRVCMVTGSGDMV